MASQVFTTADAQVLMPRQIAAGMVKSTQTGSTAASLSPQEPMKFGNVSIVTFDEQPRAQFVEESGAKDSTGGAFGAVTAVPHKAQVTMRFTDEVLRADADFQLGVLKELGDAGAVALARALDLGMYHRINPLTGNEITGWTNYVGATTKRVTHGTADWDDDFDAAIGLLVNSDPSVSVTGAAFDPKFSWALSQLKRKDGAGPTSDRRYPELGYGTNVQSFQAIPVAQGNTVSGQPEAADTKVRAIVGDFVNGFRWGIQAQIPIELIKYGDPDGKGDLKHYNQVALRLEVYYAWYVFQDRFAIVEAA